MRRRTFLVGCIAAVAGCGSDKTGAPTRTPTTEETIGSTSDSSTPAGSIESFRIYLQNRNVGVQRLQRGDDVVTLRYVPAGEHYGGLSAEIGTIAGGYLREVESGWNVVRLDAVIADDGNVTVARWHVRSAWLGEYRRGEITGEELSARILNTLERLDE